MKPLIAVTMGDPAGIGPEVIIKAAASPILRRFCHLVLLGDPNIYKQAVELCQIPVDLKIIDDIKEARSSQKVIAVLETTKIDPSGWKQGVPTAETGRAAFETLQTAIRLALSGSISAVTTGPISKEAFAKAGYPYPGHTEMLSDLTQSLEVGMLLVSGHDKTSRYKRSPLRIILATRHYSLLDVPVQLTSSKILTAIRLAHQAGEMYFGLSHPKIGVSALNPHAGENGLLGAEEGKIILPAIIKAKGMGFSVSGPYPADTLMVKGHRGNFDMIVAMYHDQALIPIKLLSFGRAVNVTVGLPFVRTSVDHGTAYDIAWKGQADAGSLIEAIRLASQLTQKGT